MTTGRRPVIGVFGGGPKAAPSNGPVYRAAVELGTLIAEAGAILLCGGRGGVMEAAARGAREGGGRSLGILPSAEPKPGSPNPYIDHAVFTGLGDGRNYLTAAVPDAAIAMAGEAGTLSEIGLALKIGTPLVYLGAWAFLNEHGMPRVPYAESPAEAIRFALAAIGVRPPGRIAAPLKLPWMPEQVANLKDVDAAVARWSAED